MASKGQPQTLNATSAAPYAAGSAQETMCHNPIIWADVPDPDVIRVGDTYYMVSTTMHLMPGGPVMMSKDLAHWQTVGYIFDRLEDSPKYDLTGGTAYGRGQWATSLKYHDGMFWALFSPNDTPGGDTYIYKTENPAAGRWKLHARMQHFHDASLFFDDDGRVYVFSGTGQIDELLPDLTDVKKDGLHLQLNDQLRDASETALLEGSRVVKHDGQYCLLMVSWPAGKNRRQVCFRSDRLEGPWEKRVILEDGFAGFPYVGQGMIVDAPDGQWYGVIFQDRGGVGRVLTLSPCSWRNGWPYLGDCDGRVPEILAVKGDQVEVRGIADSDDFAADTLAYAWQWNHNPVNSAWSLTERRGWLRLKTSRITDNLFLAPNTVSQRLEGPHCSGVVRMDVSHLKDGDRAGISAFQGDAAVVEVQRRGGKLYLVANQSSVRLNDQPHDVTAVEVSGQSERPLKLKKGIVYLRLDADFRLGKDLADLYYSTDGGHWTKVVSGFRMVYDYTRLFMGTRFAIHCYATRQLGGYVDVDYYKYAVGNME